MNTTDQNVAAYEHTERNNFQRLLGFFKKKKKKVVAHFVEPAGNHSINDGWILFESPDGMRQKAMVEIKTRYDYSCESFDDSPLTYLKVLGLRRKFSTGQYDLVLHVQFFNDIFFDLFVAHNPDLLSRLGHP